MAGDVCGRCVVGDVWREMCGGMCVAGDVWWGTRISIVYDAWRALPTTHPNHTKHFVAKCRGEEQQLTHKLTHKFSKQVCEKQVCENIFLQMRVLLDGCVSGVHARAQMCKPNFQTKSVSVYACVYGCVCMDMCVCARVRARACVRACECACVPACLPACVLAFVRACVRARVRVSTCTCMFVWLFVCWFVRVCVLPCV